MIAYTPVDIKVIPTVEKFNTITVLFDKSYVGLSLEIYLDVCRRVDPEKNFGQAVGRGDAYFFNVDEKKVVLRHYRRGGFVARAVSDRYLFLSLESSRPWREWNLLSKLFQMGFPVPRPVAATVQRCGLFYRADLITEFIPASVTFADALMLGRLDEKLWVSLGRLIRRFHDAGVFHADLNARNILIDNKSNFTLIDFDKGAIRSDGRWKRATLYRLKRSLNKFKNNSPDFHFLDQDWNSLMKGYRKTS
ncbi:MAG: 3-deoxy-D-manno-octulosonic acid kinase [Desulfuromonas sp.]|nr:MAG: 3-deoxy-D-manno-octulosonic acid kinase [Desulfuromonas sp.]